MPGKYIDQKVSAKAAMLAAAKRPAGVAPLVSLRNPLRAG